MSENFRKIKKKYLTVAIVAACILGVCLGVALSCALAVVFKTCGVNVHWAIYIPVALVLSAGSACLFFFILKPSDKRIAKNLDKDFALNQKVQTMVEFAHVESEMHELQREQTDEALGEVAKKRVDLKWLLKFLFVPVIAVAMLLAGIFVPAKKGAVPYDPPYEITDGHATALKNLITDVNNSSLEIGLKSFIVVELSSLLDMLEETSYQSAMKSAVIDAVHNIDSLVAGSNSYLKIHYVLSGDEVVSPLSTAVVNGVVNYKTGSSLTSLGMVDRLKDNAEDRIENVFNVWKGKYLAEYVTKAEGATESTPLPAAQQAEKLLAFATALKNGLADEELVKNFAPSAEARLATRSADGDALYNRYVALAENLAAHAGSSVSDDRTFYNNIDNYLATFIAQSKEALSIQSYSCMMDDYIRNALSRIFNISRAEFGSNASVAPSPTEDSTNSGDDNKEDGGGWGDGNHKYGSNDKILDVISGSDSGESKSYGDLIDPSDPDRGTFYSKYYERAMAYLNPDSDKCPPDEVASYIKQYFSYLNNGMEEDK